MVGMCAAGVAAILQTAAYGTSSQREIRRTVVRGEVVRARLDTAIRNARAVLASGNGYIVLWTGDTNPDTHVNLSEMLLVETSAASGALTAYAWPFVTADPVYAASSSFYALAIAAKSNSSVRRATWATGISGLTFKLDNTSPTLAKLVSWSLTLTDQSLDRVLVGGTSLGVPGQPR